MLLLSVYSDIEKNYTQKGLLTLITDGFVEPLSYTKFSIKMNLSRGSSSLALANMSETQKQGQKTTETAAKSCLS